MKTLKIYDLIIDGEKDYTTIFLTEENIKNLNKICGTDLHIRKRKDTEKIMNFYFEDFKTVEYKSKLIDR